MQGKVQAKSAVKRQPGISLYYQVAEILRERILSGQWRPGDQVATEDELCELFQVSRTTVRYALSTLVSEGLIYRKQGQGTYVAEPTLEEGSPHLFGFTEEMLQKGISPGSQVLSAENIPATEKVAERLNIQAGEPVIMIKRLRLANNEAIGIQTAYIPSKLCPGLLKDDLSGSLYTLLESKYQIQLYAAKDVYYVGMLRGKETKLLKVPPRSAAFVVERVTIASDGTAVEYVRSFMRGDRYRVSLRLRRDQNSYSGSTSPTPSRALPLP